MSDLDASRIMRWPPKDTSRVVHIDADPLVYSIGFAAEEEPLENALHSMKLMIKGICIAVEAGAWVCHLTHPDVRENFRWEVATIQPYKGHRLDSRKPKYYSDLREYIREYWNGVLHTGVEADDALAMAHYGTLVLPDTLTPVVAGRDVFIASIDKDLRGVKGASYWNWDKGELECLTEEQALKNFYVQCLTGDWVDHIKGLSLKRPESSAMKTRSVGGNSPWVKLVLEKNNEEAMAAAVLDAYESRDTILRKHKDVLTPPLLRMLELGPEESMIENARLLHMLEYPGQVWELPWKR